MNPCDSEKENGIDVIFQGKWHLREVKWLEQLEYGAERHWKAPSVRLGLAIRRLENSTNPAVNRLLFSNKGRIRQQKEKDGLHLSFAVPKIRWDSIPPLPQWLLSYKKPLPFKWRLE